jgi:hypothetical protein
MIRCQSCKKELDVEDERCPYCMGTPATYCKICSGVTATNDFNFRETICDCGVK